MQYAKVAEYQRRGLIHFHALIRLDGPKHRRRVRPRPGPARPPPLLADLVERGRRLGPVHRPAGPRRRPGPACWRFGAQVDARPVRAARRTDDPDRGADPRAGRRLPGQVRHQVRHRHHRPRDNRPPAPASGPPPPSSPTASRTHGRHGRRRPRTASAPYALLGKWAHMLGFRGHFSTKSRRYSVTLGAAAPSPPPRPGPGRRRHRDRQTRRPRATSRPTSSPTTTTRPPSSSGHWAYAGTGWDTDGDAALANAAAARAREYAQERAAKARKALTEKGAQT